MEVIHLNPTTVEACVSAAVSTLAAGGLVVYPTETMYGVGCDALNTQAVTQLLQYKQRPVGKAISVLVPNQDAAAQLVEINPVADQIFQTFLPGPVTVVCKDKGVVDSRLLSEFKTLGIRVSSHQFAQALAEAYGKPITSTSANAAGAARPYSVEGLLARLSEKQKNALSLVIDAGTLPKREPSTVIDTTTDTQTIIRAGGLVEVLQPVFESHSEDATKQYATQLFKQTAHALTEKPIVFALEGDLGMGKTQFAKGIAEALQVNRPVTSPSYTLVKEYVGSWNEQPVNFVHMDLWRLQEVAHDEIGLNDYLKVGNVAVVEWAAPILKHLQSLQDEIVVIRLQFEGKTTRNISMIAQ